MDARTGAGTVIDNRTQWQSVCVQLSCCYLTAMFAPVVVVVVVVVGSGDSMKLIQI